MAPRSWLGAFSGRPDTPRRWKRRRRARELEEITQSQQIFDRDTATATDPLLQLLTSDVLLRPRHREHLSQDFGAMAWTKKEAVLPAKCFGGSCGGWYESASDATMPWAFVREVTFMNSV